MTLLDGALQEAAKLAGAQRLEPVMAAEVLTPEKRLSTIIGDLHARRGQVLSLNERGTSKEVDAHAVRRRAEAARHLPWPASVAAQIVNA